MTVTIVMIDEEKCTGCGLCASACHENAIVMENGKAHLLRDDFCDGFGDCLPACPAGAISIDERECAEYDPQAVENGKPARRISKLGISEVFISLSSPRTASCL